MVEAILLGSLFDDEEINQSNLFAKQQKPKESKRFHGAFTGAPIFIIIMF
jgi:hypothetical protein